MPGKEALTHPKDWVPIDIRPEVKASGSFVKSPAIEAPIVPLLFTEVSAAGYFEMKDRARLDRQTETEIAHQLGLPQGEPVRLMATYHQVTLEDNKPYTPGFGLVTEFNYGENFAQSGSLVTTETERPFSDKVTAHIGLRARALGWVLGRRVIDVDGLNGAERMDLVTNLASVTQLRQTSPTQVAFDQSEQKSA